MLETLTVGAALSGAGGGVTLLNSVVAFVKAAQKADQNPRLADVLARIPAEAFTLAGQYAVQVRRLRAALLKAGVDLNLSQKEILDTTGKVHIVQRYLVQKFAANVDAIETQISGLLDDALAVADCCGGDDFVIKSFRDAEEMRIVIHREGDPALPLGSILNSLEVRARDMRAALGDMSRRKK